MPRGKSNKVAAIGVWRFGWEKPMKCRGEPMHCGLKWMMILGLWTAIPVLGQSTQPDAAAPDASTSNAPQLQGTLPADQMLREMLEPTTQPQLAPTTQPSPSKLAPSGISEKIRLLREGSDVIDRAGHLKKVADSPYMEFDFDNDNDSQPLAPMSVLPDRELMSMENAATATKRDLRFTVSGTVTEYKQRNYILLESGPDDEARRTIMMSEVSTTTRRASADQMLNEMLAGDANSAPRPSRPPPPGLDSTSGSGAIAPGAPPMTVLREDSQIIDRTARLVRSPDGEQAELTFESDGESMQVPPVIILPNLKLAAMETAQAGARAVRFRVTGTVTEYRGRNYILLEKVVVIPEITEQF
jgi:hypothetical protein